MYLRYSHILRVSPWSPQPYLSDAPEAPRSFDEVNFKDNDDWYCLWPFRPPFM